MRNNTSLGGGKQGFPTTKWTQIVDPVKRKAILGELCARYWKPLYTYLRCRGYSNARSKDLVQGFFTDKVLGREFLDRADRARGKFRSFLLVSLRNYVINSEKSSTPKARPYEEKEPSTRSSNPETEFTRVWAQGLLADVLRELEQECQQRNKTTHWYVFKQWLLEPAAEGDHNRMQQLCEEHGITDPSRAYNMIANIKRRFRAILRSNLRMMVESDEDVDEELRSFLASFSKDAARF